MLHPARKRVAALAAGLACAIAAAAVAETFGVGSVLPALRFEDQFGAAHELGDGQKLLLFTRDMDGGAIVREALHENGKQLLEAAGAAYVVDVHRMPGLIRAVIAKPRMRSRSYPMWLDESGELTADFPSAEGEVTLLALEDRRVVHIEQLTTVAAVRKALGAPAPGTP